MAFIIEIMLNLQHEHLYSSLQRVLSKNENVLNPTTRLKALNKAYLVVRSIGLLSR